MPSRRAGDAVTREASHGNREKVTLMTQSLTARELAAQEQLNRQFTEAMNRKDVDGTMQAFWNSPDAVLVLFDGTVYRGWENIRRCLKNIFAGMEVLRLEINEISYIRSGDCILAVGTATYHLQPKNGQPQQLTERWTDVRRKVRGRWVYVLDHAHALPEAGAGR